MCMQQTTEQQIHEAKLIEPKEEIDKSSVIGDFKSFSEQLMEP